MAYLIESLHQLTEFASSFDKEVLNIVLLSFRVSSTAVFLSSFVSLPLGLLLTLKDFPGRRVIVSIVNSLLMVPAVAIGLIVYLLLSRRGPLGAVGLLYTSWAMVVAQALLAIPIITSLSLAAFQSVKRGVRETALTLGANLRQLILTMFKESRYPLLAALIMAFARLIGETGMTMMIGGNIRGSTRVMTTTIALETMKGRFELAIVLGIILLVVCGLISIPLQLLQGAGKR
ncbi:ABC transporter permease subunit [Candidatus Aerophobetes bacterium]|uniref:ABC transporter permease subunit n=1 Tax=Aerophobetes bacterium TaxID=2030807 RepID=A0A523YMN3_UNCAE|nr:MAG: ABC transporter permease subunit [Candidatus Aerophobetes bacterium]